MKTAVSLKFFETMEPEVLWFSEIKKKTATQRLLTKSKNCTTTLKKIF
jgi:hypothetical protein